MVRMPLLYLTVACLLGALAGCGEKAVGKATGATAEKIADKSTAKPTVPTIEFYLANPEARQITLTRCKADARRDDDTDCQNAIRASLVAANHVDLGSVKFKSPTR